MEKDKDEVRQRILAAAKELFVQQGYKKTTIRQIVEKSGVLTGSIYYFFKNKEDIFQSLVMELLGQCTDLIAAISGRSRRPSATPPCASSNLKPWP